MLQLNDNRCRVKGQVASAICAVAASAFALTGNVTLLGLAIIAAFAAFDYLLCANRH